MERNTVEYVVRNSAEYSTLYEFVCRDVMD